MHIEDFEARLERLTATLTHLLDSDFDAIGYPEVADDPLGRVEETVQFLVMDIKTVTMANRDKEASLLLQQEQLTAKSEELAQQQLRIQQQERELAAKVDTIERQADAIRALSTPILEVWDKVLVLPLIGVVDAQRSEEIMTNLLDGIVRMQTRWVILDVTGVESVDTSTADHLLRVIRAAGLLGASCLLCGIRPVVAQTFADLGVELVGAKRNLETALEHCLSQLRA